MDILKRIDHAQQFCKFYADGSYSVETEKWKHHVTPKFIEDIRQYIESLQLKLMHLQTQQAEPISTNAAMRDARLNAGWGSEQQAKPVAFYDFTKGFRWAKPTKVVAPTIVDVPPMALYAAPQRPWVGLTPEDLAQIDTDAFWQVGNHMAIAMAVEDKLKERNT